MKVIVAPDSFKGTLSAPEAARAMAAGVRRACPSASVIEFPLADGGEGTAAALVTATGGRLENCRVTGPLGIPVRAHWGRLGPHFDRAVVEMAQAAGLGVVPTAQRDPRRTTTFGVGELLREAAGAGVREIIVGLGGSATNDGGAGAMTALGAGFLDADDQPLPPGGAALARLARIDLTEFQFPSSTTVIAATDVQNPLIGPNGASAVFGPQKGADAAVVAELDAALTHYAAVLRRDFGLDVAHLPGAGAAGGLGAALAAFLGATFHSGIDVVLDTINFEAQAQDAALVLTGEGRIDRQTLMGKAIAGLLARCRRLSVPLIAFGGLVEDGAADSLRAQGLADAIAMVSNGITVQEALRTPARVLEDTVAQHLSGHLLSM